MRKTLTAMAMAVALAIGMVGAAIASSHTIYDTIPDPLPSNVTSLGYAALQTAEFGQQVSLDAEATADSVTVVMSSWACADGVVWTAGCGEITEGTGSSYTHPITVNIYEDDEGVVGELITTVTQDVDVPFRPAADATCDTETNWQDESENCFSGVAFTVSFDLDGTVLPTSFIYSVAVDTAGDTPADSLNVGLEIADLELGENYWDSNFYGDPGFKNVGQWDFNILARFETAAEELTADDCKDGGFADHGFKNQGQCVASVKANANAGK